MTEKRGGVVLSEREAPSQVLTDEQILACVYSTQLPRPMGLTRDIGPYEVTEPTHYLRTLVRAIERAVLAAAPLTDALRFRLKGEPQDRWSYTDEPSMVRKMLASEVFECERLAAAPLPPPPNAEQGDLAAAQGHAAAFSDPMDALQRALKLIGVVGTDADYVMHKVDKALHPAPSCTSNEAHE